MNKFMKETFSKAELEVIQSRNEIRIMKGNIVLLEIFKWHNKVIVRCNGRTDYYNALNAIWYNSGRICLRLRKGNTYCIKEGAG